MPIPINNCSEAAGILMLRVMVLSIVAPCFVKNVVYCANTIAYTKQVAHIGISLNNAFASSTSSSVHSFPSSNDTSGVASKALFRNLAQKIYYVTSSFTT